MRHDRKLRECKRMREGQEEIWRSKCSKPRTAEPKIIECYTKIDPKDDTLIKGQTQKKAKMAMNAFSKLLSWVDEKSRELEKLEQETQYRYLTNRQIANNDKDSKIPRLQGVLGEEKSLSPS